MLPRLEKRAKFKTDSYYYGRGKLLLSGEYFVLDGAKALALPVSMGQSLSVRYAPSFDPILYWKSFDHEKKVWFEARFEFWHFNCLDANPHEAVAFLQKILRQVRRHNPHFLRDEVDVFVETFLEFPLAWGLGSSSTLVHNIAAWAYVDPFKVITDVTSGSGYDVAAAQSDGPIMYQRTQDGPIWYHSSFDPPFKDQLYFLYSGRKQDSAFAVTYYVGQNDLRSKISEKVAEISEITDQMEQAKSLEDFEKLIWGHEQVVSKSLKLERFQDRYFPDFWGQIKSLGAWGGDFLLVTSSRSCMETKRYFLEKGFSVLIPYSEMMGEFPKDNSVEDSKCCFGDLKINMSKQVRV